MGGTIFCPRTKLFSVSSIPPISTIIYVATTVDLEIFAIKNFLPVA